MKYELTRLDGIPAVKLSDPPQWLSRSEVLDWMMEVRDDLDLYNELANIFRKLERLEKSYEDDNAAECIVPDNIVRLPAIALFRPS